jgi:ABC-type glycerol-3-phosphate transport system permease component
MTGQLHVAEHSAAVRAPVPDARRAGRDRRRRTAAWRRTGFGLLVTAIVTISLFPFLWILRTSLMSSQEFAQGVTGFLPKHFTLSSYADNLSDQNFLRPLLNSILICLVSTVLSVVCATLAGYALSRLRVRGAGVVLGFVLFAGFFPVLAMVGPLFLVYRELQLLDSPAGLVLAYMVYTLPIATWLLKSFFDQVPRSLEEAAMVDGAPAACRCCGGSSSPWRCPPSSPPRSSPSSSPGTTSRSPRPSCRPRSASRRRWRS